MAIDAPTLGQGCVGLRGLTMSFTRTGLLVAGLSLIASSDLHARQVNGIPCDAVCQMGLSAEGPVTIDEPQPLHTPEEPQAQNATVVNVRVRPGRASMVNDYYSLQPDCHSRGPVQILISDSPRHGGLSVDESRMRPQFSRDDEMSVCNRKAVPVTRVFYEPQPGVAEDAFTLSITFPNGETTQEAYQVTVR